MSRDEKVVSVSERIPTLQEKRKRKANRRLLGFVILFFSLLVLLVYFQSPLSEVKTITITGNQLVTDEVILDESGLEEGLNIWNLAEADRVERLEQTTEIQEATIERKLPSTVVVNVTEYPRVGYVSTEEGYFPLLQNGKTLDPVQNNQLAGDAPILTQFGEQEELLALLGEELIHTAPEIVNRISEIVFTPTEQAPEELTLYMNDGTEVRTEIRSFATYMQPYPQVHEELDSVEGGVLYMKMSPYFKENEINQE
ncbi:cell division protein FtsQ [Bacillus sp. JCM 19046]|nr:cell division protein FtsQ [Bacillus sp. JCM 19045]GAF16472.1 cell division protein FtsQ [Bacillus sp. JCM 19046]